MAKNKREYLNKKSRSYTPLCDKEDIAKLWNCSTENIRLEYQTNKHKQTEYKMLDMGAFCIINNITPEVLEVIVRYGKEFSKTFANLDEKEIEEFKQFQKFKLFQENKWVLKNQNQ